MIPSCPFWVDNGSGVEPHVVPAMLGLIRPVPVESSLPHHVPLQQCPRNPLVPFLGSLQERCPAMHGVGLCPY